MKTILETLNKKIDKLEEENKKLFEYKVAFDDIVRKCKDLEKQLDIKRKVMRVVVKKDDFNYILQLTMVSDTQDGLYIEGQL
ncbi:MAG TPA: hypothetical protein PLX95_04030 [bacterium]|nr:hypothetical protein [bacterium]